MKKIFTLLALCIFAISANAFSVFVKCDTAPFIWWWGLPAGQNSEDLASWPGTFQFTETWTDTETGDVFWKWTFDASVEKVSFLLNNGDPAATKQTGNITGITTDSYFILSWDDGEGGVALEDITEEYVEVPDAQIDRVTLKGNHNGWSSTGEGNEFSVVEAGKTFKITVNTANYSIDENLWQFKFCPNDDAWVGYWEVYYNDADDPDPEDGRAPKSTAPAWLSVKDGNFLIDLENTALTDKNFTFIATWNGGKKADKNWTFTATNDATGIATIKALNTVSNAPIYNLQGQRVDGNYRGIAIQNGRKVVVK